MAARGREVADSGREIGDGAGGVDDWDETDEVGRWGSGRVFCGETDIGAYEGETDEGVDAEGRKEVAMARVRLRVASVLRIFCTRSRTVCVKIRRCERFRNVGVTHDLGWRP